MTSNNTRADWAAEVLYLYAAVRDRWRFDQLEPKDQEDVLSDLLADLHHFADREDLDFTAAISQALWHYDHEREYPPDEDTPA